MTIEQSHEFKIVDSELLIDAPIVAVRRDTLVMPGGNLARREIVEHFGAVAVVAYDGTDIALVRQYRHSVQQRLWELPAGLLDIADENELIAAQRELLEESGVSGTQWSVLTDLVTSPGFCEETVRVFLVQDLQTSNHSITSEDEEAEMIVEWVPLERACEMVYSGEIVNAIAIAGILCADAVISGRADSKSVDSLFELRPHHLAARRKAQGRFPDMKKL